MEGGPGRERGWAERGQRVAGKTDCVERGPRSKTGAGAECRAENYDPQRHRQTLQQARSTAGERKQDNPSTRVPPAKTRALHPQNLVPGEKAARV